MKNRVSKSSRHHRLLQSRSFRNQMPSAQKTPFIVIIVVSLITLAGLMAINPTKSSQTPSHALSSSEVAFMFAGKVVTVGKIRDYEIGKAQSMLDKQDFSSVQNRSEKYALYQCFDEIEVDMQLNQSGLQTGQKSRQDALNSLMDQIAPQRPVSNEEAGAFYNSHPSLFARSGPKLHVREIAVADFGLAKRILAKLRSNESFASLAQQYSVDPKQYSANGGDLGWVRGTQMPPEWVSIVFSLAVGQVSDVFGVGNLYYIAQVLEAPSYDTIPYEDISSSVPAIAAKYLQQEQFLRWLSSDIVQEQVEIKISTYTSSVQSALAALAQHPDQTI